MKLLTILVTSLAFTIFLFSTSSLAQQVYNPQTNQWEQSPKPDVQFGSGGAIDSRTGTYFAPSGAGGVIDTRDGTHWTRSGDALINTRTGETIHSPDSPSGGAINPNTGQHWSDTPGGGPIDFMPVGSDAIAIDPQTGKIFHRIPSANAAIDPETGRVYPVSGGIVIGYRKEEEVEQQTEDRHFDSGMEPQQIQSKSVGSANLAPYRQIPNWNVPPYRQVK